MRLGEVEQLVGGGVVGAERVVGRRAGLVKGETAKRRLGGQGQKKLSFGTGGGVLLRPRQAAKLRRRSCGVRRSGLGLQMIQGGGWGAVLKHKGARVLSSSGGAASRSELEAGGLRCGDSGGGSGSVAGVR